MARYIDAGVLIGKLVAEKHFYPAIVERAIDDTPTADVVEVKHAFRTLNVGHRSYCSNCGGLAVCEKYCSLCGAKMDGGGEDHISNTDFVEVVRCKDCKYWQDKNSKGTQGICLCGEKDMNYGGEFYPFANDFCSYGERKDV